MQRAFMHALIYTAWRFAEGRLDVYMRIQICMCVASHPLSSAATFIMA